MRNTWLLATFLAASGIGQLALAADHRDGPRALMDPAADINDVYAWMSADGAKMNLVMTVFPAADQMSRFSNTLRYVFHTTSAPAYGMPGTDVDIVCTFDVNQWINCWAGPEWVGGDPNRDGGLSSASGRLRVWAGLREDPFFFNLDGFNAVRQTVAMAASMLTFNMAGCPALDTATSMALVNQLRRNPMGSAPADFFRALNTLAIVVEVDRAIVTPGGPIVAVWGATHR